MRHAPPDNSNQKELTTVVAELLQLDFQPDHGGRRAHGGFIYQHLYVLRLMRRILEHELTAYICENGSDFLAANCSSDGEVERLELIEVKSRSKQVFGRDAVEAKTALEKLSNQASKLRSYYPQAQIICRLVFSRVDSETVADEERLREIGREIVWPQGSTFEAEAFVSAEPTFEEMQRELTALCAHEPQLLTLFSETQNREIFLEALLGLSLP